MSILTNNASYNMNLWYYKSIVYYAIMDYYRKVIMDYCRKNLTTVKRLPVLYKLIFILNNWQ